MKLSPNDAMWACLVFLVLIIVYGIVGESDYQDQLKIEQAKVGLVLGKRYQL